VSCAVSCSTAEFARPAPNTRKAPSSSAKTPATRRSFAERVTEDVVETAMTTSVQALGKSLPRSGDMPSSAGRSPGSWRPALSRLRNTLAFPGYQHRERWTIRRKEASGPWLIAMPPSGFSGWFSWCGSEHHCPMIHTNPPDRMNVPRHSTVAGSAVIAAPYLGPPRHIPIYSPIRFRIREPSNTADDYASRPLKSIDRQRHHLC
jgi:hypothetical protein